MFLISLILVVLCLLEFVRRLVVWQRVGSGTIGGNRGVIIAPSNENRMHLIVFKLFEDKVSSLLLSNHQDRCFATCLLSSPGKT